jgi:NTE family protein
VLASGPECDTLVFQVDLFSALGQLPRDLLEAEERRKDIGFSSRTRFNTEMFHTVHSHKRAIVNLYERLSPEARQDPAVQRLYAMGQSHSVAIVHLIYRRKNYETQSKDYEFSRASMQDHWRAGYSDAQHTLRNPKWLEPIDPDAGVRVYDLADGE